MGKLDDCRAQGRAAYDAGLSIRDNPYAPVTDSDWPEQHKCEHFWNLGYLDGVEETVDQELDAMREKKPLSPNYLFIALGVNFVIMLVIAMALGG